MRYLVKARLKPGKEDALRKAIANKTLGTGSIAGGEYLKDMDQVIQLENEEIVWVEVCYCEEPLDEEKPYWEEYFELINIKNAHNRNQCKDLSGEKPWHCGNCDCTKQLEAKMKLWGPSFKKRLFHA